MLEKYLIQDCSYLHLCTFSKQNHIAGWQTYKIQNCLDSLSILGTPPKDFKKMCNPEVKYFTRLNIYGQTDKQSDRTWCRADPTSSGSTKTFYTLILNQNIHTNLSYSIYFDIFSSDFFWYIFWSKIQHNIIWIFNPNVWSLIFFKISTFHKCFVSRPNPHK